MNQSSAHHFSSGRVHPALASAQDIVTPQEPRRFHHPQNLFRALISYDEESALWLIELSSEGKEKRFHGVYRSRAAAELSLHSLGFIPHPAPSPQQ